MIFIQTRISFLILKVLLNKMKIQYINLIINILDINFLILNIKYIFNKT